MARDRLKGRKTLKVTGFLEEFEKDAIKDKVDIVALFAEFGLKLERKGKSYTGLCPWHDDKKPSLSVDREKGLYNCFGCGESGDVFSLVQKIKGYDFKQALKYLQERAGKDIPRPGPKEPETDLNLNTITDYYHKKLYENKKALDYLESRGLNNPELLGRFKLGYADGSLLKISSNGQREALKLLGLINEKKNEHFYNCITFPITGNNDQVVGIYGRGIESTIHLYIAGKHKSVFNRKASKVYEEIILTESIIDALSLIQLGIQNVQACYGTNGFTEEHLAILKDDRVKTVLIGFDNDQAGRTAAEKLKDKLVQEDFTVKVVFPPAGKDWNEYLLTNPDADELKNLIDQAKEHKKEKQPDEFTVCRKGTRYLFESYGIRYRVIGVRDIFVSSLRVNIRAEKENKRFLDNVDLYSSRSRTGFSANLAHIFEVEAQRVENDLLKIVDYLEEERDRKLYNIEQEEERELTQEETELGLRFLKSRNLFKEIVEDMSRLGYVGEETNKLLIYLSASSRKLDDPLSVIIVSESASGKSMLVETVKRLMPEKEVLSVTSLSDQALNYLPDEGLMHKFLILGEAVHSEVVEHQLREMLSAHELCRMIAVKDEKTGELTTRTVKKKVVVAAVMSSTRYEINPENASRCFVINTDESREQTKKIYKAQGEKYSIKRYREKQKEIPLIIHKHRTAQRILKKRVIVNPYGSELNFPDKLMRGRRDHERFIDLLAAICFLRQYQKEAKHSQGIEYIECDETDYETAYSIVSKILPSTLTSFPKSAVMLYDALREIVRKRAGREQLKPVEVGVTQRELREQAGFSQMFVKRNMRLLVEWEYVRIGSIKTRGSKYRYYLVKDEDLKLIDLSMIPTPHEIKERINAKLQKL
jgi:DNA primase